MCLLTEGLHYTLELRSHTGSKGMVPHSPLTRTVCSIPPDLTFCTGAVHTFPHSCQKHLQSVKYNKMFYETRAPYICIFIFMFSETFSTCDIVTPVGGDIIHSNDSLLIKSETGDAQLFCCVWNNSVWQNCLKCKPVG